MRLKTRDVALIGVFAALQVILGMLPGIPMIGVESGKIELTVVLIPVIGIMLGPWVGGLAAFLGGFITWLVPSVTFFGLLMLPTGPIGAMVAGSLARTGERSNWRVAALLLVVLNGFWYLSPPGFVVPYYPILHLGALALVLVFRSRIAGFVRSDDKRKLTWGTAIASFAGIMANHLTGTLIFIASVGWFVQLEVIKDAIVGLGLFWLGSGLPEMDPTGLGTVLAFVFPISVAERLVMTAIAVPISVGIFYAVRKSGVINI